LAEKSIRAFEIESLKWSKVTITQSLFIA